MAATTTRRVSFRRVMVSKHDALLVFGYPLVRGLVFLTPRYIVWVSHGLIRN